MYQGSLSAVTNQADWIAPFEVIDDDTDEAVDLSTATITFQVRPQHDDFRNSSGSLTSCASLSATTANGKVTILDTGVFQVWFTLTDMKTLASGNYDVGCVIEKAGVTTQFFVGTLPVIDGIVT